MKIIYGGIAFSFSMFYGLKADSISGSDTEKQPCSRKIHKFWKHFIESITGWAALYYLIFVRSIYKTNYSFNLSNDIVPLLVAIIGITGRLPYTLKHLAKKDV
jgi:hypothetical protein